MNCVQVVADRSNTRPPQAIGLALWRVLFRVSYKIWGSCSTITCRSMVNLHPWILRIRFIWDQFLGSAGTPGAPMPMPRQSEMLGLWSPQLDICFVNKCMSEIDSQRVEYLVVPVNGIGTHSCDHTGDTNWPIPFGHAFQVGSETTEKRGIIIKCKVKVSHL